MIVNARDPLGGPVQAPRSSPFAGSHGRHDAVPCHDPSGFMLNSHVFDHEVPAALLDLLGALSLRLRGLRRKRLIATRTQADVDRDSLRILAVTRGGGVLECDDLERPLRLSPGDVVLIAGGRPYTLSSRQTALPPAPSLRPAPAPAGPIVGPAAVLELEDIHLRGAVPAVQGLPPIIHLEAEDATLPGWLTDTLGVLDEAPAAPTLGGALVNDRAAELLFLRIMQRWSRTRSAADAVPWQALRDARIGAALAEIHGHPQDRHTVASLAAAAGMSRATFAARFHGVVGVPPMSYLVRYRMEHAAALLRRPDMSLAEVAECTGYSTEAALAKAFKREMGISPGAFRRQVASH
jgi:AraC-like DNA-binding protein